MIPMKRSFSSPVRKSSSPPTSPLATHQSSTSTTPPPESREDVPRVRRTRSPSPGETTRLPEALASAHPPGRRSEERTRHGAAHPHASASAQRKRLTAQHPTSLPSSTKTSDAPSRSGTPPSDPMPKSQKGPPRFPQSLLSDALLYTNPIMHYESEGTTLEELAHLVRLSKYQERKRASTRTRLQRSLISTALSARLTRCGESTQKNLAEYFRAEDKKAFSNLYNAIHDVRSSCNAARRYALLEPEMDPLQSPPVTSEEEDVESPSGGVGSATSVNSVTPFLNDISASAREAFLGFLTQIRTNPHYLATRLCSLNSSELQALATFHQGLEPHVSMLPFHRPGPRSLPGSANRTPSLGPNAVERLLSFQRHDPLSALIYTCFANSAGPDSDEDRRRTDIWAWTCARLVTEAKSNSASELIMTSVLNVWASMRDWSGRSNMEWFLMKILGEGAFLLDRAEDKSGTKFNISEWTPKDNIAAEEFYGRAVNELFEILDDEDATGLPEGLLELGNEILLRLDTRFLESTRRWFVCKWLFSTWMIAVVVHPEAYGMMADYHITEYGRHTILKQVAQRAQQLVLDMAWNTGWPGRPSSTPLNVKTHVEKIFGRFKPSQTQPKPKLLPARSITSLKETAEVRPFLVVSPADLLTLVNALFPERKPLSSYSGSVRSGGAPSISGSSTISQPLSTGTPRHNVETASVFSMSASSVLSDATTSRDPLVEDQPAGIPSGPASPTEDAELQRRMRKYEDDGYRLRLALHEMVQTLGAEVVSGSCHPCAERWAVLFVSADGNDLSLQMTFDPDDDPDDENSSSTSETEDEETGSRPELDKDYHQLRDSILKLVEDFEIPRGLDDDGTKTRFSNRPDGLKKNRSKTKIIATEPPMASRNPYKENDAENTGGDAPNSPTEPASKGRDPKLRKSEFPTPVLITMLEAASSQSNVQADFISAHLYWNTLKQLKSLTSPSLRKNGFATLLNIFSRGPRDSIRRSASAIEEYDAWLIWLKQSQERHEGRIDTMVKRLKALRDKTWYVTDVHNSAPYEQAKNVCSALKIMGVPRRWGQFQRTRAQLSRGPAASYLYKNESQMLDLLAATEVQGGPNKLSDDQAEKTAKWLEVRGIENFCKGEERLHRFCCEIESCIDKLVGETILDGPVLWSSELYMLDRKAMEGAKSPRDRESLWVGDDTASVHSDPERRYGTPTSRHSSAARDLRSMTAHNVSQLSVDSRHSFSRGNTSMSDILDGSDYFGVASPVHAIDSNTTFWSPFQSTASASSVTSRTLSPRTSVTGLSSSYSHPYLRPLQAHHSGPRLGTSVSSSETVHLKRLSEEKNKFLEELRQMLKSLLLSDLGNRLYSTGSETDTWFNKQGQESIDRLEAKSQWARRPAMKKGGSSKSIARHRVIGKKKSFGNLRGAGDNAAAEPSTERSESPTVPSLNSSTSSVASAHSRQASMDEALDFPYKKAYQRLLRMFAVHPNPHVKMNALYELKNLILASLSSGGRRSKWNLRHHTAAAQDDDKADPAGISVDSVKGRRSHALQSPLMSPPPSRSGPNAAAAATAAADAPRPVVSVHPGPGHTDSVVMSLQSMFRDAGLRPRTLFRDLQFIASFVPPAMLDRTERGKAFWDAGLAALSLKQDVCQSMVEAADDIVKAHTQPRRTSPGPGDADADADDDAPARLASPSPSQLGDAARMWTITAREGDATAQRELGLFLLSSPELVERTTLPLSKPREVFKQVVMEKFGSPSGGGGGGGDPRSDPATMCVAIHWMEAAAQGGDALARTFLGQHELA